MHEKNENTKQKGAREWSIYISTISMASAAFTKVRSCDRQDALAYYTDVTENWLRRLPKAKE